MVVGSGFSIGAARVPGVFRMDWPKVAENHVGSFGSRQDGLFLIGGSSTFSWDS